MRVSDAVALIADTVEAEGMLLIHDQRLPSVTSLVCGEAVAGSWWSHPLANVIYNALGALENRFATCKLVTKKLTLVAPGLWPELAAVGQAKESWQVAGLSPAQLGLLERVEAASVPVKIDPSFRSSARRLEERLLVVGEDVHGDGGRHFKALLSWREWELERSVIRPIQDLQAARARFEQISQAWDLSQWPFPWPSPFPPS